MNYDYDSSIKFADSTTTIPHDIYSQEGCIMVKREMGNFNSYEESFSAIVELVNQSELTTTCPISSIQK